MPTQTALLLTSLSHPVTPSHTHPIPTPGPSQLQIRTTLTALNPHDQLGRDIGLFTKDHLPAILGSDVVGVVTALGANATRFKLGDLVFGQADIGPGSTSKGLQEYAVLEEAFAARVPAGLSEDEVATLPTNLVAGVVGFFDEGQGLGLRVPWSGEGRDAALGDAAILIIGGGANCGRFATQLAKLVGFGTIVVVGGKEDELKGFGATHVIDRHGGHDVVLGRVREVVGDELVYAFDAVNGPGEQHLAINALSGSIKGTLARLKWTRGEIDEGKVREKKEGYVLKGVLGFSHSHREIAVPFWRHIGEYLEDGKIRPLGYVVEYGLDADKVNAVLDRYRDGKPVTQTHFRISEYKKD